MPCTHKFYGHQSHQDGNMGLLPNWKCKTLIIGTFNPQTEFRPGNPANYYYGHSAYFWKTISRFCCIENEIQSNETLRQLEILNLKEIGLTDLLICVNDADINNNIHVNRINTYRDSDLELFTDFTWNTDNIISFINAQKIKYVYFTKLGNRNVINPNQDTFEYQMRIIETHCVHNGIVNNYRLHTPSGQGLRNGIPRENKLIQKWYHQNGANHFPFTSDNFNINNFPFD